MQYIKVTISPGQRKRTDISNWMLSTGEYIWIGQDSDTFDDTAVIGSLGDSDPTPPSTYSYAACTQEDIDELKILSFNIRKQIRLQDIGDKLIEATNAIIEIYEVGEAKGLWESLDFSTAFTETIENLTNVVNEHNLDTLDPPTE